MRDANKPRTPCRPMTLTHFFSAVEEQGRNRLIRIDFELSELQFLLSVGIQIIMRSS
jgi:hypothetical protein